MGSLLDYVDTSGSKYFKVDELDSTTWICGYTNSPIAVPTSSPFWAIQRISKAGNVVTVEWANNGAYTSVWDDRLTYFNYTYSNSRSVNFDGVNDYVRAVNTIGGFLRTSPFSVSLWVRANTLTATSGIIGNMPGTTSQGWGIRTGTVADGKIIWNMLTANATNEIEVITNAAVLQIGQWVHIVATYSGSSAASGVIIYVNGSAVATTTSVDNLTSGPTATATIFLGMLANGTSGPLAANIDEVSIHNRVLTGAEVTAMYNSGDPTNLSLLASYSSVMYWWRMGDGDTYPIIDDRTDNQDLQMYNSLPSQIEGVVP